MCQVKGLKINNCSTEKNPIIKDNEHNQNSIIASIIAQKAALKAKEASHTQTQAGIEAALKVKEELAERAKSAARIAQAALAGNQGIVDELKNNIKLTERLIKEGTLTEQSFLQDTIVVMGVGQQIEDMIKQLQILVQIATQAQINEKNVVGITQNEVDSKSARTKMSCQRLRELAEKLKSARADLEKTMRIIIKY